MGRKAIREAVAETFANAALTYVGGVHPAAPELITEDDYERNRFGEVVLSQNGSGSVLVVHIPSDARKRRADTGRGAVNDTNVHQITLEVFFACSYGSGIKAQEDYDTIIDEIIELVRANPTMGGPVWSAGELDAGVVHEQGQPFRDADGATVFIHGAVKFEAWEWIAGTIQ